MKPKREERKPKHEDAKPKLENSKVALSNQEVDRHLAGLTDFPIPTTSLAPPIQRKALTTEFGVHPQWILSGFTKFPDFDTKVAGHGLELGHFVLCCKADINPRLPLAPGGRGFLLSNRRNMCGKEFSLFCRVYVRGRPLWRYDGEYVGTPSGVLSESEFAMQNKAVRQLKASIYLQLIRYQVKKAWAEKIMTQKHPEYLAMRDIIQQESGKSTAVDENDIIAALMKGVVVSNRPCCPFF